MVVELDSGTAFALNEPLQICNAKGELGMPPAEQRHADPQPEVVDAGAILFKLVVSWSLAPCSGYGLLAQVKVGWLIATYRRRPVRDSVCFFVLSL